MHRITDGVLAGAAHPDCWPGAGVWITGPARGLLLGLPGLQEAQGEAEQPVHRVRGPLPVAVDDRLDGEVAYPPTPPRVPCRPWP